MEKRKQIYVSQSEFVERGKANRLGLRTCRVRLGFGTSRISEEVCKLGSNRNAVLCERLGVEPHETCRTHMLEEGHLVVVGHVFLIGVVVSILAKEMGEIALLFVATEIQADAGSVLECALIGQGFPGQSSLLDMEEADL